MKQHIISSLMVSELSQSSHSISDEEAAVESSLQTILNEHSRIEEGSLEGAEVVTHDNESGDSEDNMAGRFELDAANGLSHAKLIKEINARHPRGEDG